MEKIELSQIDPTFQSKSETREDVESETEKYLSRMFNLLYKMNAQSQWSLLIILQGIDASGKDGTVTHLFSGANPQGMRVHSFKEPSKEELMHDFLWRCHVEVPQRGETVIFNRSYYEEVTTVKVHKDLLKSQNLPSKLLSKGIFEKRYQSIVDFEKLLVESGTKVLKFFLHISKKEQKKRFEERLKNPEKKWKFSKGDLKERKYWDEYMDVFTQMINRTHSEHAPWYVIPADKKWYRNYAVSKIIVDELESLKMSFPKSGKGDD